MRHISIVVVVLFSMGLTACANDVPTRAQPPHRDVLLNLAGATTDAKLPKKPIKVKAWPAMKAWMAGKTIPRDATMSVGFSLPELQRYGKGAYKMYCANCHGDDGKGDGPRAPMFSPPPRDFTRANYRFRSTPAGELPTSTDLFRTISGGLHGTGMPAFADLPEADRWAIVAYLRSFSPRFAEKKQVHPVAQPIVPKDWTTASAARIERGRKVYAGAACASCHGAQGAGDGVLAAKLVNTLGQAIKPRNFALEPFKYGAKPADIYRVLVTGLDGTPMTSYASKLSATELWDVVAYVSSLGGDGHEAKVSPRDVAEAKKFLASQRSQAKHAVVGGCGCQARRRKKK